jgi:hypothetical protein
MMGGVGLILGDASGMLGKTIHSRRRAGGSGDKNENIADSERLHTLDP